jgi:N-acetylneuraminate synthase
LEELNSPAYKIASLESLHFPLIKEVCKTNKPLIISTGTLSISEIDELLKFLKKIKYEKFIIMHCVSDYPTKNKDVNLKFISYLRKKYNCLIGFSDHTNSLGAAISSISYGACIIEKHLKLNNSQKSLDHQFSIDPSEMEKMILETNNAWESIGNLKKVITKGEQSVKKYRRSIYCFKTIKKGERLSKENIKIIRPGKGMDPKNYEFLLGKKASKRIELGQAINLKLISKSS